MDDYISRNAVFDWFCESADIDGCVDLPKNNGSCKKGCRHCISGQELDEIQTANVVEVVRCKDCKHRDAETGFCEGRGWPMQLVPDCGFCDKGERREDVEETD